MRYSSAVICRARSLAMCSKSRIIVSIDATLRAFSLASNRLSRNAVSCGFMFDTPNLFERVMSLVTRPKKLPDSGRPPIKQATCQTIPPPTALLPTRRGPDCRRRGLHRHVTWLCQFYIKPLSCGKATRKSVRERRAARPPNSLSTPLGGASQISYTKTSTGISVVVGVAGRGVRVWVGAGVGHRPRPAGFARSANGMQECPSDQTVGGDG